MFEIEGLDELIESMQNWRERLETEAAPNIVQRCLDIGEQVAKQEVPVRTGFLRDSINQSIEDQFYGELIAEAPYAAFCRIWNLKDGSRALYGASIARNTKQHTRYRHR